MLKICENTAHKLCAVTESCHYGNYSKFCNFVNRIPFACLQISDDLLIFKEIGSIRSLGSLPSLLQMMNGEMYFIILLFGRMYAILC